MVKHGGRLEAVVPAREYRAGLPSWHHPTYDALLRQAIDVHQTGLTTSDSAAHMVGSEILVGLADQLLALWDGKPARGHGDTADVVGYAERTGTPVQVVWPQGATRGCLLPSRKRLAVVCCAAHPVSRHIGRREKRYSRAGRDALRRVHSAH
ncbi:hypothetical protein Srufu_066640 [Streptomyces libani subsp. rufus]|nr:hypothetical protein Srufu_066640 [Streptomyces libani subsp. rufus]